MENGRILFSEFDSEKIRNEMIRDFEDVVGETLHPSDERAMFLNNLAQVVIAISANTNDVGNSCLLRFARGNVLDELGDWWGVERLPAESAITTLKFTLSAAQSSDVVIPFGTRATPDGEVYFATTKALTIKAGELSGEVEAKATTAGVAMNGYIAGQIKYIVDNIQFLKTVENTTASGGGADQEDDESYRERIRLSPEALSTAGTEDGYIFYAKSASGDVGDVVVYSPVNDESLSDEARQAGAGKVYIYILKSDGTIPTEDDAVLTAVKNAVSAKDVRPLTDFVTVLPPTKSEYTINLQYYISRDNAENEADIKAAVTQAINEYIDWQDKKIGRDINPDRLKFSMLLAGASRVVVNTPIFAEVTTQSVAKHTGEITATFAGYSE